jgi:hypothetical protein
LSQTDTNFDVTAGAVTVKTLPRHQPSIKHHTAASPPPTAPPSPSASSRPAACVCSALLLCLRCLRCCRLRNKHSRRHASPNLRTQRRSQQQQQQLLVAWAQSILRARVLQCADANLTKRAPAAMRCNWTASTAKNVTICASPSRKPGDPSPSTTHHMQNQMNTIRSTTIRAAAE